MKRLLAYLKPHKWVMTAATVLVLFIIVVELYRPIVIGDDGAPSHLPARRTTRRAAPTAELWLGRGVALLGGDIAGMGFASFD